MSLQTAPLSRRFSVAPMMDWTDRHCRFFLRLLSKQALLYTEMVTTGAVLHGDRQRFLRYSDCEHPLALQLGGSNPADLSACARLAEGVGYDEVNLNVGCPSDRVQNNMIGACLMGHPQLVADCVKAMQDAVDIPVTVKHRIGINGRDSYAELEIILNGGIKTLEDCQQHLQTFDGVMLGREAYHNPYLLAQVDQQLFGSPRTVMSRFEAMQSMRGYIAAHLAEGGSMPHIPRHMLGLGQGFNGARRFRQLLSVDIHKTNEPLALFDQAAQLLQGR